MDVIRGNLITLAKQGEFDIVAHGCNCFCTMGAGIAKSIKQSFPEAYAADSCTKKGDKRKLGTCTYADISKYNLVVVKSWNAMQKEAKG